MARKAYGLHATQVNLSSYPDDGTSPVGSAEWNEALDPQGMLGFTPQTSTVTIASGALLVTDSVTVVAGQGGAADDLDSITLTNTSEYDLLYLFGNASYDITLKHGDLNVNGEISTVSGEDEVLSATKPTILIRKGNYWYGYGGGTVSDAAITFAKIQNLASMKVIGRTAGSSGVSSEIAILDEDNMATDSATSLVTQQSVKAYVDAQTHEAGDILGVTAGTGLTGGGTSGTVTVDVIGGTGITANANDIAIDSTVATLTGTQTLTNKTLTAPALGTPASGVLTNCTALPAAQVAQGTMASGMVLVAPVLGTPASGALTNCTALPAAQVAQGTMASGMVLVAPALGTPASGVATNLSGTAASLTAGTVSDNAITLAKMAAGTDGNLISYDTNGDPAAVATGTATHVLTSNGAGAAPTFQAPAGGSISGHQDYGGQYDAFDVQRVSFEIQLNNFDDSTRTGSGQINDDLTGESQVYVKVIDSNNDGVFARVKKNGSIVNVQLA